MYMAYLVAEEPVLFLHTLLSFFLGWLFFFFFGGTRSLGEDCLFQLHGMMKKKMMMMIILPPALVLLLTFSSSITKASKFPSHPILFYSILLPFPTL